MGCSRSPACNTAGGPPEPHGGPSSAENPAARTSLSGHL